MSEIHLNTIEIALIKKAIQEGKKSILSHDLMFNIYDSHVTVTNAHTGKEMTILNWMTPEQWKEVQL